MAFQVASDQSEHRAVSAYLGLAIGDALGSTVEFMSTREIKSQFGVHAQITGGGWLNLKPGEVTDDTTMSLALGDSILHHGGVNAHAVAEAFSQWLLQNPVDVGNTVKRGIMHFRYSGETSVAWSEKDAGNGACMRTLPVALATLTYEDDEIVSASREQAHVTHNNELSDAATECVIKMLHLAFQGSNKSQLLDYADRLLVKRFPEFDYREERIDNPSGYIVETMRAVLQAFAETDSFEQCLINVVNRGGDADTSGAIAGMLAGCLYGVETFPARWLATLNSEIRIQCEQQAIALLRIGGAMQSDKGEVNQKQEVLSA